jgi:N utilization substance protein B
VDNREIIRRRQKARKLLVQALYQWHMNHSDIIEIQAQFLAINNTEKFDEFYFSELLKQITKNQETIDGKIIKYLDRPFDMLNPVELAVLRLSTYEFLHQPDIPFKVIIDEAISLCKTYGAIEGHRYVNGVLHQLATELRQTEVQFLKKGNQDANK